jgi:hypothetical protein
MAEASPVLRGPWPLGINNRANEKTQPEGSVRDSVNVDPSLDGVFRLRAGYSLAYQGQSVRGALSVGSHILIADGTSLIDFNTDSNTATVLAQIAGAGRLVGDVLNSELFFCTENQTLRFKEGVLRRWGVPTVTSQPVPSVGSGSLRAGTYQCAATFLDAFGDEGGTTNALIIDVPENSALFFQLPEPPQGGKVRLYVSSVNGATPYLQYEGVGSCVCSSISDATARLETQFLNEPEVGDIIAAHNGVLLTAAGSVLHMTVPLRPHLRSAIKGFFQFPQRIDVLISCDGGVYIASDKTQFLTGLETSEPAAIKVFDFGAVPGSGSRGIKKEAVWMTKYGIATSDGQGGASLISEAAFVPGLAGSASTVILERDGNQMAVTTMKNPKGQNPLAASDHYETEIVTP